MIIYNPLSLTNEDIKKLEGNLIELHLGLINTNNSDKIINGIISSAELSAYTNLPTSIYFIPETKSEELDKSNTEQKTLKISIFEIKKIKLITNNKNDS